MPRCKNRFAIGCSTDPLLACPPAGSFFLSSSPSDFGYFLADFAKSRGLRGVFRFEVYAWQIAVALLFVSIILKANFCNAAAARIRSVPASNSLLFCTCTCLPAAGSAHAQSSSKQATSASCAHQVASAGAHGPASFLQRLFLS